jgi:hypothetical protein
MLRRLLWRLGLVRGVPTSMAGAMEMADLFFSLQKRVLRASSTPACSGHSLLLRYIQHRAPLCTARDHP